MPISLVNQFPTRRQWGTAISLLSVYAALAVWSTWPLAPSLSHVLPLATEDAATVPLFNLWTVWWNADRAAAAFSGYWNAPIFHPAANAFAFSEPQCPTVAVAPLIWWSESPTTAYNVYLLLSLTLNGWSACRLFRRLDLNWPVAFSGGVMVLLLPFVHWQLGVLQLVPLYGVIWTIHALVNFGAEPNIRSGLAAGVAFAWTYLLCAYYGLFLLLLLIPSAPWLAGRNLWNWQAWGKLLPGAAVCLLMAAPVLMAQKSAIREPAFKRQPGAIKSLSAEPGDYTVPAWPELVRIPDRSNDERRPHWKLSPGTLKWLLAAVGTAGGLFVPGLRRWIAFCLTAGFAAFILSQGTRFQLGNSTPYQLLIDYVPGVAQVRNVFRFALFTQLFTVFSAVIGLELLSPNRWSRLWQYSRRTPDTKPAETDNPVEATADTVADSVSKTRFSRWSLAGTTAFLLLSWLAVLEIRPPAQPLFHLPALAENKGWIDWLDAHSETGDVIACIPFPKETQVGEYLDTTIRMYWQTFHRRRMVNGYSGFFPDAYRELKDLMSDFPNRECVNRLRQHSVRYCIVRRDSVTRDRIAANPTVAGNLLWKFGDDAAGIDIYLVYP